MRFRGATDTLREGNYGIYGGIFATRPADYPADVEYIQIYNFDEEGVSGAPFAGDWLLLNIVIQSGGTDADGWFQIIFVTNQDASEAGKLIYVDNFRITVPAGRTAVEDWSLF